MPTDRPSNSPAPRLRGSYVGRFAPSPTGTLHLGSLSTAVASFLHARQADGEWIVRMDDIDPAREAPGAAATILRTLEALELYWDGSVVFQSTRYDLYREAAARLVASGRAFHCSCSRKDVLEATGGDTRYPGTCRDKSRDAHEGPTAIRARADNDEVAFTDKLQGPTRTRLDASLGDYVIYRRDELPAYHLANVIDDEHLGVTDVVRGVDLLESTAAHVHLAQQLGFARTPHYWHLPVIVDEHGNKLSKQTGARAIEPREAPAYALSVLERLGLVVPSILRNAPPRELWEYALDCWDITKLERRDTLPEAGRHWAETAGDPALRDRRDSASR